jgi:hypothetical protein
MKSCLSLFSNLEFRKNGTNNERIRFFHLQTQLITIFIFSADVSVISPLLDFWQNEHMLIIPFPQRDIKLMGATSMVTKKKSIYPSLNNSISFSLSASLSPLMMTRWNSMEIKILISLAVLLTIICRSDSSRMIATTDELPADEQQQQQVMMDSVVSNCTRCSMQTEARSRRLEEVKMEILHKLGLSQAPNVTIKDLPRIPPLHNLLGDDISDDDDFDPNDMGSDPDYEQMSSDMPSFSSSATTSSSSASHEYEDFYVSTEKSISFAKPRESIKSNDSLKLQTSLEDFPGWGSISSQEGHPNRRMRRREKGYRKLGLG